MPRRRTPGRCGRHGGGAEDFFSGWNRSCVPSTPMLSYRVLVPTGFVACLVLIWVQSISAAVLILVRVVDSESGVRFCVSCLDARCLLVSRSCCISAQHLVVCDDTSFGTQIDALSGTHHTLWQCVAVRRVIDHNGSRHTSDLSFAVRLKSPSTELFSCSFGHTRPLTTALNHALVKRFTEDWHSLRGC